MPTPPKKRTTKKAAPAKRVVKRTPVKAASPAKKASKVAKKAKKASARPTSARPSQAEYSSSSPDRRKMTDEERWNLWEKRLLTLAVNLIAVGALADQFFVETNPNEQIVLAVLSILGLGAVIKGARSFVGGGER